MSEKQVESPLTYRFPLQVPNICPVTHFACLLNPGVGAKERVL